MTEVGGRTAAAGAPGGPGGSVSRGMVVTLLGNLFPPLVALITGPILAQALGVTGRGQVAAAIAPLGLAMTLMTFGVPEAVTYTVARQPRLVRAAVRHGAQLLFGAGLFAMAALYGAREWLSAGDASIRHLMGVAALAVLPSLLVGVSRGIASSMGLWSLVAAERVLASVLRLVVLIPLMLTDHLTPFTATVVLAGMPLAGAVSYLRLRGRLPAQRDEDTAPASRRRLTAFGIRMWVGSISGTLLSRVDQALMTPLSNAFELGLYVVAVNLSELPLIINKAVRDVTFVSDARDNADDRLSASGRISTAACTMAALVLGLTMPSWLPALFGADFAGAVPVAAVLLVAVVAGTPGSIAGAGLSARGRPGLRSIAFAIACVVNIALLVVLVPRWGAMGAAWAFLVGTLLTSSVNLLLLRRYFGIPVRAFLGVRRSDAVIVGGLARRMLRTLRRRRRAGRRAT